MVHDNELQLALLENLYNEKLPVAIYLKNGIKLLGLIVGFDSHVILLKDTSIQLIYTHAISTVQSFGGVD